MVNKTGLQVIGWVFGGTTAAVIMVATVLVGHAIASGSAGPEAAQPAAIFIEAGEAQ
jgi:hypothetical protein